MSKDNGGDPAPTYPALEYICDLTDVFIFLDTVTADGELDRAEGVLAQAVRTHLLLSEGDSAKAARLWAKYSTLDYRDLGAEDRAALAACDW